ncbi:hypothetical protein OC842_003664 [Tilletia horrida]|uniref:Aquaporin n=1 Tax=Tilletia horrida TaxID=155126 RepID=A0AAN6GCE6_9BASI|nr:hypothetical protein OC842_003664 [Tilletia horrida]
MPSGFSTDSFEPTTENSGGNGGGRTRLSAHLDPFQLELWRARFDNAKTATPLRRVLLSCVVEVVGIFLYSWFPLCTAYAVSLARPSDVDATMVSLQSGIVCMLAIWLALVVCMPSTRGYFHPCFTVLACLTGLCKWKEAPFYIIAQVFGGFLSTITAVGIYWDSIKPLWEMQKQGLLPPSTIWSGAGVATVIGNFRPDNRWWGLVLTNQFVENFAISLVVSASLDSTNPFSSPTLAPIVIGAVYGIAQLANAPAYLSDNPALWLGGRFACAAVFGHAGRCFPAADSANMILGPFVGYIAGFIFYFLILADTRRPPAQQIVRQAEEESQALAQAAQKVACDAQVLKEESQEFMQLHEDSGRQAMRSRMSQLHNPQAETGLRPGSGRSSSRPTNPDLRQYQSVERAQHYDPEQENAIYAGGSSTSVHLPPSHSAGMLSSSMDHFHHHHQHQQHQQQHHHGMTTAAARTQARSPPPPPLSLSAVQQETMLVSSPARPESSLSASSGRTTYLTQMQGAAAAAAAAPQPGPLTTALQSHGLSYADQRSLNGGGSTAGRTARSHTPLSRLSE